MRLVEESSEIEGRETVYCPRDVTEKERSTNHSKQQGKPQPISARAGVYLPELRYGGPLSQSHRPPKRKC